MENFPNLIHLYLQRNLLTKIENLDVLTQLKKIYLGYNGILVLEGLENLTNLTEIHIENQNLPLGETLLFEPRTIQNLAASIKFQQNSFIFLKMFLNKCFHQATLQFLNVSSNNLTTLSGLENLVSLEVLIANDNLLSNLNDVTRTLAAWPFLKRLNLIGNLVTEERKYRDSVIVASKRLGKPSLHFLQVKAWKRPLLNRYLFSEILDNKPILVTTRKFIEKLIELQKSREEKKTVPEKALRKKEAKTDKDIRTVQFSRIFENEDNFPNLAEILPPLELSDLHPAWKLSKSEDD